MRLLFVCPDMRSGGAERHWATLIAALHGRGATVQLVCLSDRGALFDELEERGVPSVCIGLRRRADPRGLRRALATAASFGPDVVVTRGVSGQLVGEAIARRAEAAHVLNEHTPVTTGGELVRARAHQRALIRLVAPRVDGVIAVTSSQLRPLAALGYRRDRMEAVPNGLFARDLEGIVPAGEVAGSPDQAGDRPAEAAARFTVLCVAGLRPEKRVDLFIAAVRAARRSNTAIRAFVAGDGRERERLERIAEGSGVTLLGGRSDALALIAASDALCLPSEAEALPMTILEAMALGRPVVATDVGGVREQVVDGETGLVVPPADAAALQRALIALAEDPDRARELGQAGRRRQRERFDGDRMVDGYVDAFEAARRRAAA